MNFLELPEKYKNNFYKTNFTLQSIRVGFTLAAVTFFSNCFIPQISAVWAYFASVLFAKLLLNKGDLKPFLKAFIFTLVSLLLGNVSSFFYLFLSQTELYTIYEYFDGDSTPYFILFSIGLGIALSIISLYATIPPKKKKPKTEYSDFA